MFVIAAKKSCPIALTVPAVFRFVKPVLRKISGGFPTARHGFVLTVKEFA
jgi:hypothetical protein